MNHMPWLRETNELVDVWAESDQGLAATESFLSGVHRIVESNFPYLAEGHIGYIAGKTLAQIIIIRANSGDEQLAARLHCELSMLQLVARQSNN